MPVRSASEDACRILAEDADLAEAIPAERRGWAVAELTAEVLTIGRGRLSGDEFPADAAGLLVLRGLLVRRLELEGRFGSGAARRM